MRRQTEMIFGLSERAYSSPSSDDDFGADGEYMSALEGNLTPRVAAQIKSPTGAPLVASLIDPASMSQIFDRVEAHAAELVKEPTYRTIFTMPQAMMKAGTHTAARLFASWLFGVGTKIPWNLGIPRAGENPLSSILLIQEPEPEGGEWGHYSINYSHFFDDKDRIMYDLDRAAMIDFEKNLSDLEKRLSKAASFYTNMGKLPEPENDDEKMLLGNCNSLLQIALNLNPSKVVPFGTPDLLQYPLCYIGYNKKSIYSQIPRAALVGSVPDIAASLGTLSIKKYCFGELERKDENNVVIKIAKLGKRVFDSYDFIDLPSESRSQPLGYWSEKEGFSLKNGQYVDNAKCRQFAEHAMGLINSALAKVESEISCAVPRLMCQRFKVVTNMKTWPLGKTVEMNVKIARKN
jgi:hypothetical protein